ncbi:MAG: hypothetical protein EXR12_03045 [Rhodospirillaceae bacterium]|nr:hypothetical protein [Rhodospirillaceae bacterium]
MTLRLAAMWIVLAAVLGFALGGSFVWSFSYPPHSPSQEQHTAAKENKSADHATNKAEEAIAEYTWWLTAFTGGLVFATIGLGIATVGLYFTGEKQIGLARNQFVAANRPRITVRFVQGPLTYTESGKVGAAVTIANIGPSDATIIAIGCDIGIRRGNRWASNIDGIPKPIPHLVLRSGQRHTVEAVASEGDGDDNFYFAWGFMRAASEAARTSPPDQAVAVAGEIVYRDGIGIERHTGFLRTYDRESDRWVLDQDPGNEHED